MSKRRVTVSATRAELIEGIDELVSQACDMAGCTHPMAVGPICDRYERLGAILRQIINDPEFRTHFPPGNPRKFTVMAKQEAIHHCGGALELTGASRDGAESWELELRCLKCGDRFWGGA